MIMVPAAVAAAGSEVELGAVTAFAATALFFSLSFSPLALAFWVSVSGKDVLAPTFH